MNSRSLPFCEGFLTSTAEKLFRTIWGMQPRDVADTTIGVLSKEDKVKVMIEDLLDKLPEEFNIQELMNKVDVRLLYRRLVIRIIRSVNLEKSTE